jgi:hypothetical protein
MAGKPRCGVPVRQDGMMGQKSTADCGLPESECGVVEQQGNEGTKFSGFSFLFSWLFKKTSR